MDWRLLLIAAVAGGYFIVLGRRRKAIGSRRGFVVWIVFSVAIGLAVAPDVHSIPWWARAAIGFVTGLVTYAWGFALRGGRKPIDLEGTLAGSAERPMNLWCWLGFLAVVVSLGLSTYNYRRRFHREFHQYRLLWAVGVIGVLLAYFVGLAVFKH